MFDTEKFICEIRDRPCIWDTKEKYFSNRAIKKASWEEIAKIFDPTWEQQTIAKQQEYVEEIQKKWKHIRDYYVRLRKGKLKIITKRRGTNSYIELLNFLDVKIEPGDRQTDTSEQEPVDYESDEAIEDPLNSGEGTSQEIHFEEEIVTPAKKTKNEDADTNFLLSLLPQVRGLNERQNCEFRMEVMNLLYRIKYRTDYTYHRSGSVVKKRRPDD